MAELQQTQQTESTTTAKATEAIGQKQAKITETAAAPKRKDPTGPKVLVVDDERAIVNALRIKLESKNFQVDMASNGSEALQKIEGNDYKAIVLDLVMPITNGFAVLETLNSKKKQIPVIVATNLGQEEDVARAKELGAVDYFVKANTPLSEMVSYVTKYAK